LDDEVMELASLSLRNPTTIGLTELPKRSANISFMPGKVSVPNNGVSKDSEAQNPLQYNVPIQLVQRYITGTKITAV
jgi:hypothetical protein